MAAEVADARGTRSRDNKTKSFSWTDLKLVHEFGDDSPYKGHAVAYIDHPDDLAALGKTMGHCAGTHFIWACEEKIWYFFTVVTLDNMRPHVTLHAKDTKWVGKNHPRDKAEYPYAKHGGSVCHACRGYGGIQKRDGRPYYLGYPDVVKCKTCKGTGHIPAEGQIPFPKSSDGYYPSYKDVCAAFESVGKKYEAGKYAPLEYNSRTYEIPKNYREQLPNFEGRYGRLMLQQKPEGIEAATWKEYQQVVAAMKAQYDKGNGAVQIVGRTFKFDNKNLVVLSLSGKGDYYSAENGQTKYRGMMHEFFVASSSKKKEADGN